MGECNGSLHLPKTNIIPSFLSLLVLSSGRHGCVGFLEEEGTIIISFLATTLTTGEKNGGIVLIPLSPKKPTQLPPPSLVSFVAKRVVVLVFWEKIVLLCLSPKKPTQPYTLPLLSLVVSVVVKKWLLLEEKGISTTSPPGNNTGDDFLHFPKINTTPSFLTLLMLSSRRVGFLERKGWKEE